MHNNEGSKLECRGNVENVADIEDMQTNLYYRLLQIIVDLPNLEFEFQRDSNSNDEV
jgi:hypothetical protein